MKIAPIDFAAMDVQLLLKHHLTEAQNDASTHALGIEPLKASNIAMFEARDCNGALMGFAALKELSTTEGEIKSVRTHPEHIRKGVSAALMDFIERLALKRNYESLFLETHPTEQYTAARALYEKRGYVYCGPFADYTASGKSVFMKLTL